MTEEESIEIFKNWLEYNKKHKNILREADKIIAVQETILNLIQKLQEENKKKDKMIDLMAECMAESISCDFINITDIECKNTQCKDCMKRYFNNEAEKQLNKRTMKEKE